MERIEEYIVLGPYEKRGEAPKRFNADEEARAQRSQAREYIDINSSFSGGGKATICSSYLYFLQLAGENQYGFRFVQAHYAIMPEK